MSAAVLLGASAAVAGVFAVWEALSLVDGRRLGVGLAAVLRPLGRAAGEGREPSTPERRRLSWLAALTLLAGGWIAAGLLVGIALAVGGPLGVSGVIRARRARYATALGVAAGPVARALADALAAGSSVRGALPAVADAFSGPCGHALRSAAHDLAIGEPTVDVLERLRRCARSRAWDTMVAAILIQRDAGGDLAGLLRDLAISLESARRLEREAASATAQARLSAWMVLGMPLAAGAVAELGSPGFVAGLLSDPISAPLTAGAVTLQLIAVVCIRGLLRQGRVAA